MAICNVKYSFCRVEIFKLISLRFEALKRTTPILCLACDWPSKDGPINEFAAT